MKEGGNSCTFTQGEAVAIKVSKLSSVRTQLPYDFYELPYCKPKNMTQQAENIGEILRGDRIEASPYMIQVGQETKCAEACSLTLTEETAKRFSNMIEDQYRVYMILDNLPAAVSVPFPDGKKRYERGFPVGFSRGSSMFIHNHLRFTVLLNSDQTTGLSRIVGFEVEPRSVAGTTCESDEGQPAEQGKEVHFTYDVVFRQSDIRWASRWDPYLLMEDEDVHWFSIINSLIVVFFLSGMIALIMIRTLRRDIAKYNEEEADDGGWKLLHGDAFRPPPRAPLLCVCVGTGVQLAGMALVTICFAMLGFLSPANRGGLMTAALMLFAVMGLPGGFASARLHKALHGRGWALHALRTALLFPGIAFACFTALDALLWAKGSTGAVPLGTFFVLCFLWFGISTPLVFAGAYLGYGKPTLEAPTRTNKIPRPIPEQPLYLSTKFAIPLGAMLPFGAVFIELFFILTSVWLHQFYYVFGFLFLVFGILLATCAETSVVLCYFQLCAEDYRWWWRSFLSSAFSAVYFIIYAAFYYFAYLEIDKPLPTLLYFTYNALAAVAFALVTGTAGFLASLAFVRTVFSSIKIE